MHDGKLTIRSTRAYWAESNSKGLIRAQPGLLDSFLGLANTSQVRNTLATVQVVGQTADRACDSDERIRSFASRFGGLEIFHGIGKLVDWPDTEHIEHCDTWRYFAGALAAMLRIASSMYRGEPEPIAAWHDIHVVPLAVKSRVHKSQKNFLATFVQSPEEVWLSLASFAGKKSQPKRSLFVHLTNALVELAQIRPWFSWPSKSRSEAPVITYGANSLLSNLALQFCLRVTKVDAFLVCDHCHRQYTPTVRAPRTGYRGFCQECRKLGIPKRYASRDYKTRQRANNPT